MPQDRQVLSLSDTLLLDDELVQAELEPRKVILHPWLHEKSFNLVTGFRGSGKTWFGLSLFHAITRGKPFGPWRTLHPVPALYLESEMSIEDIKTRVHAIGTGGSVAPLWLYSDDYTLSKARDLNCQLPRANLLNPQWRAQLEEVLLEERILLLGLDNLASLSPGRDENSKKEWDPINQWLISLRFKGISTVLFHHTNKAGGQRGTSAHEDNIDVAIVLNRPSDYRSNDGCRFVCSFEKRRSVSQPDLPLTEPLDFQLSIENEQVSWTYTLQAKKHQVAILELYSEGLKQVQISESLQIDPATVSRTIREAREKGTLPPREKVI